MIPIVYEMVFEDEDIAVSSPLITKRPLGYCELANIGRPSILSSREAKGMKNERTNSSFAYCIDSYLCQGLYLDVIAVARPVFGFAEFRASTPQ